MSADPALKQRFVREAKTVAALSHICPVFDVGSQDGINYLSHVAERPQPLER